MRRRAQKKESHYMISYRHHERIPSLPELINYQSKDAFCEWFRRLVGIPGSLFTFDINRILGSKAAIDWSIQKLFPTSLIARLFQQAHYSRLARHPGERKVYDSLRKDYHLPHMVTNVYNTDKNCSQCPRMGKTFKHQRHLDYFHQLGLSNSIPSIYLN